MARGAKKPRSRLAAVTQPFTHGSFLIRKGRGMGTLSQGEQIDSMRYIREDLEATAYASYIVEIIDRLTEDNERVQGVYDLLYERYKRLMKNMILKQFRCLSSGRCYRLAEFIQCCINVRIVVRQKGNLLFHFKEIGFLCHRCFHIDSYLIRITPNTIETHSNILYSSY